MDQRKKSELVGVRLTPAGLEHLDNLRGDMGRAEYFRELLRRAIREGK